MMSDTLLTAKVVHAPYPMLSNSPSPVGRFRTGTGRSIPLRSGRHRLSPQARVRRLSFLAFLVCLPLIVVACSTPVGVKRINPRAVHRTLTTSVLSADTFSTPTRNVLYRRDLFARFENAPEEALADLRAEVAADRGGRDDICALAELSFFYAENTGKRAYYLASKEALAFTSMGAIPTAVHNMTPGTRFIRTLAALPVAPGVAAHSIIAVQGDGPPENGNDGIVEYQSAHIDGVESELVVRSAHSCQANPHTINEVRRILFLQRDAEARREEARAGEVSAQERQAQWTRRLPAWPSSARTPSTSSQGALPEEFTSWDISAHILPDCATRALHRHGFRQRECVQ
jgi:hypothetical protein